MQVNFNKFSINFQRWKYAILTGNFYLIFLPILQKWWHLKHKSLVFPTVKELFLYIKAGERERGGGQGEAKSWSPDWLGGPEILVKGLVISVTVKRVGGP